MLVSWITLCVHILSAVRQFVHELVCVVRQLLDSSRSDWWLVTVPESGRSGWVPADYLEKKEVDIGRVSSPRPEPFMDETGEIERVIKR